MSTSARNHLSVLVAAQDPARLMTCCMQYSQKGCPFALASQALGMACAQGPPDTETHACAPCLHSHWFMASLT